MFRTIIRTVPDRGPVGLGIVSCVLVAAVAVGCGGKKGCERVIVSGTVTFQGQPVASGQIRFVPTKDTQAPISGAGIIDGKYSVEANGGVPVGTHKIKIIARHIDPKSRELAKTLAPGEPGKPPPAPQYIPRKYNARTELEITIPQGSRKITKDFNLTN